MSLSAAEFLLPEQVAPFRFALQTVLVAARDQLLFLLAMVTLVQVEAFSLQLEGQQQPRLPEGLYLCPQEPALIPDAAVHFHLLAVQVRAQKILTMVEQ